MANKIRPVAFVRHEDFERRVTDVAEAIWAQLDQLNRQQAVLEIAVVSLANDVEALSEALWSAGLLEGEPDDQDEPEPEPADDQGPRIAVDPDNPAHEVDLAGDEETPEEEAARLIAEARAAAEAENEWAGKDA